MERLLVLSVIAFTACGHKPPPPAYKPNGAHVFVSPEGLGDVDPSCTGKVPELEPPVNIAQSLGVGLARAGFRSVLALEDDILVIEPTIHVHACNAGSSDTTTEAAGDLTLVVSKSGRAVDRIIYDVHMQPITAWVKQAVGYVLASPKIAAAIGR